MAIFFILLGLAMIGLGISAWFGWYRSWARGPLGNTYIPGGPMGFGVLLAGLAGLLDVHWLGFPSVFFMLGGALLYVVSPDWLQPTWYREFKRSRNKRQL
jgi:hypothetical protein